MRCSDVRDMLHPFLDGELEVSQNVAVLKHLEMCPPCRRRSESETQLRELVERSAGEPLASERRRELVAGALAAESGRWRAAPAPRSWWPGLLAAAGVLLAAGAGLYLRDPYCWRGCATLTALQDAHQVLEQPPQPISAVEERLHRRVRAPQLVGPELLGANSLSVAGLPAQPVMRYRVPGLGQLCLFAIPDGHPHVGRRARLQDGREYLVIDDETMRFVGWLQADGTLVGCLPCGQLPREELFLVATAIRDGGSG